jgi:hypothetical protein
MTNIYPRESVEFQPILVTLDGDTVTTGVETQITLPSARPSSSGWTAATTLNGNIGLMISGLSVGTYEVWARVTDSPEIPVIDCGSFAVS